MVHSLSDKAAVTAAFQQTGTELEAEIKNVILENGLVLMLGSWHAKANLKNPLFSNQLAKLSQKSAVSVHQ